jgi:hypothetical protein
MSARDDLVALLPGAVTFDPDMLEGFRRDHATSGGERSACGWRLVPRNEMSR